MENQDMLFNENDFDICITKAKYLSNNLTDCEEVFAGFDEIRVVTYSYGLKFVEQIIKKFSYAEVIVGNHKLLYHQSK